MWACCDRSEIHVLHPCCLPTTPAVLERHKNRKTVTNMLPWLSRFCTSAFLLYMQRCRSDSKPNTPTESAVSPYPRTPPANSLPSDIPADIHQSNTSWSGENLVGESQYAHRRDVFLGKIELAKVEKHVFQGQSRSRSHASGLRRHRRRRFRECSRVRAPKAPLLTSVSTWILKRRELLVGSGTVFILRA